MNIIINKDYSVVANTNLRKYTVYRLSHTPCLKAEKYITSYWKQVGYALVVARGSSVSCYICGELTPKEVVSKAKLLGATIEIDA